MIGTLLKSVSYLLLLSLGIGCGMTGEVVDEYSHSHSHDASNGGSDAIKERDAGAPIEGLIKRGADVATSTARRMEGPSIELIEDLVISDATLESGMFFHWLSDLAIGPNDEIYAVDTGANVVKAFDRDGEYVGSIGGRGRGPGEFVNPLSAAVVGEKLAVFDDGQYLLNIYTLGGEYITRKMFENQLFHMDGTDWGFLVGRYKGLGEEGFYIAIVKVPLDGGEAVPYAVLSAPRIPTVTHHLEGGGAMSASVQMISPNPWFAAARSGEVFITSGEEYEVTAFDRAADAAWTMRIPWPRETLSLAEIEGAMELLPRGGEYTDADFRRVKWPDRRPALSTGGRLGEGGNALAVDGHGHLYIFPYLPPTEDAEMRPVDVYSLRGELLFTGVIRNRTWTTARGDHVYGIEEDAAGEDMIVRYRLDEPF